LEVLLLVLLLVVVVVLVLVVVVVVVPFSGCLPSSHDAQCSSAAEEAKLAHRHIVANLVAVHMIAQASRPLEGQAVTAERSEPATCLPRL
jgi:flagellar basal body-associated protein FliL